MSDTVQRRCHCCGAVVLSMVELTGERFVYCGSLCREHRCDHDRAHARYLHALTSMRRLETGV